MSKGFREVFEEIKTNVSVSASGKPLKTFNRKDFDKLAKAYLNEIDYKIESVSTKKGELIKTEIEPVKELRSMLKRILLDFGVDQQEAENIMSESYEIKSVQGIYELCSELIYQYLLCDKRFNFITREDFSGALKIKEHEESITEHKNIKTGEPCKVKKKKHRTLEKISKTPKWLKSKVK